MLKATIQPIIVDAQRDHYYHTRSESLIMGRKARFQVILEGLDIHSIRRAEVVSYAYTIRDAQDITYVQAQYEHISESLRLFVSEIIHAHHPIFEETVIR